MELSLLIPCNGNNGYGSGEVFLNEVEEAFAQHAALNDGARRLIQETATLEKTLRKAAPTLEVLLAREKLHQANLQLKDTMRMTDKSFQCFVQRLEQVVTGLLTKQNHFLYLIQQMKTIDLSLRTEPPSPEVLELRQKLFGAKLLLKSNYLFVQNLERLVQDLLETPLPPEIWEKIFEMVKDSKDLYSVINASQQWSNLLQNQKTIRLFSLVLPVLQKTNPSRFSLSTLLSLRLVHSEWRLVIDSFLNQFSRKYLSGRSCLYKRGSENRISPRFLKLIATLPLKSDHNPFPGNYVDVSLKLYFFERQYLDHYQMDRRIIPIFEASGHHIKHAKLTLVGVSPEEFTRLLASLPNLEQLVVQGSPRRWTLEERSRFGRNLPQLPRLVGIEADINKEVRVLLLMKYRDSIKSIRSQWSHMGNILGNNELVLNLTSLSLWKTEGLVPPTHLQTLSEMRWRLKKLSISGSGVELSPELIQAVNNFSSTLIVLILAVRLGEGFDPATLERIAIFPMLSSVSFSVQSPAIQTVPENAQWFLSRVAPNLKTLHIQFENAQVFPNATRNGMKTGIFSQLERRLTDIRILHG